jgi:hypothetical protein
MAAAREPESTGVDSRDALVDSGLIVGPSGRCEFACARLT